VIAVRGRGQLGKLIVVQGNCRPLRPDDRKDAGGRKKKKLDGKRGYHDGHCGRKKRGVREP